MCDAFLHNRLYGYFFEDEISRKKFLTSFMRFRLKYGIEKGKVFVSDDCESVIILINPHQKMSVIDMIRYGGMKAIFACSKSQRKKIMSFNAFADAQTEKNIEQPYWHISPICVSQKKQGQGYGYALMQYSLDFMKSYSHQCYLETQDPKNVAFYQKHGFQAVADVKFPDADIRNYSMVYSKG